MNDRELLELAARAAGIAILRHGKTDGAFINGGESWSPLTEDGAALRLAVGLKLDICFYQGFQEVCIQGEGSLDTPTSLGEPIETNENFGDDVLSATRRAIVRAAAEIGRNMP